MEKSSERELTKSEWVRKKKYDDWIKKNNETVDRQLAESKLTQAPEPTQETKDFRAWRDRQNSAC